MYTRCDHFHHETGITLSGVYAGRDHYTFSMLKVGGKEDGWGVRWYKRGIRGV